MNSVWQIGGSWTVVIKIWVLKLISKYKFGRISSSLHSKCIDKTTINMTPVK